MVLLWAALAAVAAPLLLLVLVAAERGDQPVVEENLGCILRQSGCIVVVVRYFPSYFFVYNFTMLLSPSNYVAYIPCSCFHNWSLSPSYNKQNRCPLRTAIIATVVGAASAFLLVL